MSILSRCAVWLLQVPILIWQWCISPVLGPNCRYSPNCSHYAMQALKAHGPVRGSWLAVRRILSCHPWGGSGYDPVPPCCAGKHDHDTLDKEHGTPVSNPGT